MDRGTLVTLFSPVVKVLSRRRELSAGGLAKVACHSFPLACRRLFCFRYLRALSSLSDARARLSVRLLSWLCSVPLTSHEWGKSLRVHLMCTALLLSRPTHLLFFSLHPCSLCFVCPTMDSFKKPATF